MKFCPYCGVSHARPDPAVYCSPGCARAGARHSQAVTAGRTRATERLLGQTQVKGFRRAWWRDVAFGRREPGLPPE